MLAHFQIFDFLLSVVLTQNFLALSNKHGKQPSIFCRRGNKAASQILHCLGLIPVVPFKINNGLVILIINNSTDALLNLYFSVQVYCLAILALVHLEQILS